MDDLKAKVVLVTGASSRIGATCAKSFCALGCKVAVYENSSKAAAKEVAVAPT